MRTIKFRIWDFEEKKMIYPSPYFDEKYVLQLNCHYMGEFNGKKYNSIRLPLMQFTGLQDKNGREVYEGDVVKCPSATEPEDKGFICRFKDCRWKFCNVRYPDDDFYGTVNYNYIQQNCEVIGNIHENHELL